MPCNQDLYFRTKDNEIEVKYIKNAFLRPIDSPFGHCAANPGNDKNFELQLDKNITELLNQQSIKTNIFQVTVTHVSMLAYLVDLKSFKSRYFSKDIQPILT